MDPVAVDQGRVEFGLFVGQLRELWVAAGKPSYRLISRQLESSTGRFYSKSVIGDVLAGRRTPKRMLLLDLVAS